MKNIFKFIVVFILIAVPLYPKFPFIQVPGTFVSIRLEDLLLFLASLFLIFYIFKTKKLADFFQNGLNLSIILFLCVSFVSLISGLYISKTVMPGIGFLHWLRRVEYFVPFFLGLYALKADKNNLPFFINSLLLIVIISALYGIGQKYYYWPIIITQNQEYSKGVALRYVPGGHINSTFAGHYDLGTFLVLVLPLFVSVIVSHKGMFRYFYSIGFLSGLWLLVSTASRISLVSYVISILLALVILHRKRFIPLFLIVTLLFASSSANLVSRYERIIEVSTQKFRQFNLLNYVSKEALAQEKNILPGKNVKIVTPTPTPVFEDRSSNIRLNVEWPRAFRAFFKNPLLGTGYSSITLATDNDYLRLLGEVGLLGFASFMLIIINLLLEFLKKFPFSQNLKEIKMIFVVSLVSALPGILLNAVFIDVFEASKFAIIFWLMMGFAVGILNQRKNV